MFTEAFRTYEAASGWADSQAGDDLGGLLFDWGCGLVAAAGASTRHPSNADNLFHVSPYMRATAA